MLRSIILFLFTFIFSINLWAQDLPCAPQINSVMTQYIKAHQVPGAAIAVYIDKRVYYFNYGVIDLDTKQRVTKNTLFEAASVTKVFTSTLLAYELGQGKLGLSDHISNYIPALQSHLPKPVDQITIQNLATHTSGLPRDESNLGVDRADVDAVYKAMKAWQPSAPIGTCFSYSNLGFNVLGSGVLPAVTGLSFDDLLKQIIFTPLNMNQSFLYVPDNHDALRAQGYDIDNNPVSYFKNVGAGELISTSADLIKFVIANLDNVTYQSSPALLNAMQAAQQTYYQNVGERFDMGLGWQKYSTSFGDYIGKDGEHPGFSSFIGFIPQKQVGVVVLFNKNGQQGVKVGEAILEILSELDDGKIE
jgi:beta-lactamase class C